MKTLTPEQRIEGFTELEGVLGEGGVGGAHLMSFLAGIAHAEKVLAEPKQDEEPFGYVSEHTTGGYYFHRKHSEIYWDTCVSFHKVFLHPAPRPEFVRLSEEEIIGIVRADPDFDEMMWDKTAVRFARVIEVALEEKNK